MHFILLYLVFFATGVSAQVGVGTISPTASAMLEVSSTTQGFLPPRMTIIQRNAMQNTLAPGLMIYCTDCGPNGTLQVYNGIEWTNATFVCGNSYITFKYNNAWVSYGTVIGANSRCWLDRNLGANQVAASSTDHLSYGDLFQWGRGDDGHQIKTSPITTDLSATDQPGHGQYIITYSSPYDWRTSQNNNLWQGVSGTNNPCPSGWRLPTAAELESERQSWSSNNSTGAFNSVLKLPTAGERSSSGGYSNAGTSTFLYSSDIGSGTGEGIYTKRLSFSSTGAAIGISNRANGGSVRCIKN
jgi:hypothetical protein